MVLPIAAAHPIIALPAELGTSLERFLLLYFLESESLHSGPNKADVVDAGLDYASASKVCIIHNFSQSTFLSYPSILFLGAQISQFFSQFRLLLFLPLSYFFCFTAEKN